MPGTFLWSLRAVATSALIAAGGLLAAGMTQAAEPVAKPAAKATAPAPAKPAPAKASAQAKPAPAKAAAAATAAKGPSKMCVSDSDLAALNMRALQTELMVAALSCEQREQYNRFVNTNQTVLTDRGQTLQSFFRRAHGAQGTTRLNSFITKLANDTSKAVRLKGDDYCIFSAELFDETFANSTGAGLNHVANKQWIIERHGYQPCMVQAAAKSPAG